MKTFVISGQVVNDVITNPTVTITGKGFGQAATF